MLAALAAVGTSGGASCAVSRGSIGALATIRITGGASFDKPPTSSTTSKVCPARKLVGQTLFTCSSIPTSVSRRRPRE